MVVKFYAFLKSNMIGYIKIIYLFDSANPLVEIYPLKTRTGEMAQWLITLLFKRS